MQTPTMLYVNGETIIDLDDEGKNSSDKAQKLSEDQLENFWPSVTLDIKNIKQVDAKNQVLPLARIKKIMKLDENAKMIAAEAPLLFAKAAEIFIQELTLRAWIHTQGNKRRTLQKSDIATAITKCDQFDFLIDIVPREEANKPTRKEPETPKAASSSTDQVHYYFQLAQQHQQALQNTPQSTGIINQTMPVANTAGVSVATTPQNILLTTGNTANASSPVVSNIQQTQPIQLLQQVVTPTGEITHVPITITPNQLNLLRMGLGNTGNTSQAQQVIIPTLQTQQSPIVQVANANQQHNATNIYLNTTQQQQAVQGEKKTLTNQFQTNC